jgi:hypothetical protein
MKTFQKPTREPLNTKMDIKDLTVTFGSALRNLSVRSACCAWKALQYTCCGIFRVCGCGQNTITTKDADTRVLIRPALLYAQGSAMFVQFTSQANSTRFASAYRCLQSNAEHTARRKVRTKSGLPAAKITIETQTCFAC